MYYPGISVLTKEDYRDVLAGDVSTLLVVMKFHDCWEAKLPSQ